MSFLSCGTARFQTAVLPDGLPGGLAQGRQEFSLSRNTEHVPLSRAPLFCLVGKFLPTPPALTSLPVSWERKSHPTP